MAKNPGRFAAIHIGSEQVSMQIVEYEGLNQYTLLDRLNRSASLGEETFKTGRISFATVSTVCEILKGYRRLLNEYSVKDYRLVATTAIREAENQHYIIDQIRIKSGFAVKVLDVSQEIFFKYVSLYHMMELEKLTKIPEGILFVDISSGGLGVTLYQKGQIHYQQNLHIGTLRIKEAFNQKQRESREFPEVLNEYLYSSIEPVKQEISPHNIRYLVLSGFENRLLMRLLGRNLNEKLAFISLKDFNELYDQVKWFNVSQLMNKFGFNEDEAEMVLPTIVLYHQILSLSKIQEIIVPNTHFMDGVTLLRIAEKTDNPWVQEMEEQIDSLVQALGEKYHFDQKHAQYVTNLSLAFFDRLSKVHGLGARERQYLKIAAWLHDVGRYISLRNHYYYSYRLIVSSDILGFSEEEKRVIANVAHYHSRGIPSDADPNFSRLSTTEKITVAKLSAIIRLAEAIDRSHCQKIESYKLQLKGDLFTVQVTSKSDISLEEWTFQGKAEFFESVFGIRAELERKA